MVLLMRKRNANEAEDDIAKDDRRGPWSTAAVITEIRKWTNHLTCINLLLKFLSDGNKTSGRCRERGWLR